MAINNYENLIKSIIEWSHQDDANLLIPDFVKLTEVEMFSNDEEILKLNNLGVTVELTLVDGKIELPSDIVEIRSVKISTSNGFKNIIYKVPQAISYDPSLQEYTIIDNVIVTNGTSESIIKLDYVSDSLNLSNDNDTNEVLEKYPNIYLFGALYFLKEWADEPQDAQNFYIRFIKAIRGANKRTKMIKYPSGLTISTGMEGQGEI